MAFLNDGTIHLGYSEHPWAFSESNDDVYSFRADPVRRKLKTFRNEAIDAAIQIGQAFDGLPIYVLYSGGIDSEVVVEAFRLAKVPCVPVCIKFDDGRNMHELQYAFDYLSKHGMMNAKIIDFNIKEWLKSAECLELAGNVQSIELGYTHLFKVALDHLGDGVTITGHEEPLVWAIDNPATSERSWVFHCHERHYSIHKFFLKYGRQGVPSFFQWSTELLNSFMHNDHWLGLFNNQYARTIWTTEQLKYGFFGKEFGLSPRRKYTSFERLVSEILDADKAWNDSLPVKWNRTTNIEIHDWYNRCGVKTIW